MAWYDAAYFGNTLWNYLLFLAIIVGAVFVGKIITWTTKNIFKAFAHKTTTKADDIILEVLEAPVLFTVFIMAFAIAKRFIILNNTFDLWYSNFLTILIVINVVWYAVRFVDAILETYIQPMVAKSKTDLDDHLLPIAKKLINFLIIALGIIIIADKFNYNIASLVAGLGIGGLAFALAAKDLLGNMFGGIAILADKPFKLNDRVKIGDVDGYVREIGLRTMRIETFGGTMITVPNSKVVDSVVENINQEKARRMVVDLGLEYDTTPAKLEEAKKILGKIIKKEKLVKDDCTIAFTNFGDSALGIKLIYWITKEGLKEYFSVIDRINMNILKEFNKSKLSFAFPTQTVHVKK